MSATASDKGASGSTPLSEQQVAQRFQSLRSEMTSIATKISEIEGETEEHRAVIETLKQTAATAPDRKCFRLIGGVLVERKVAEVVPTLEANVASLRQVLEALLQQYKGKEEESQALQKKYQTAQ
ncbi:Molecular chaperone Prefoldin, subunit 2 [Ceraceosorus bombacis]|uniref:Molecular chaperone Prefoldin, subunit 2 n=1 Tax=Ceraceosorus bombacis TaxID=401625 RepID=A0A0N7LB99_9BASI|nr:Molecular chaperone Prefoldin, subunit 2 [Ceraceosorus bombacis]